MRTMSLQELQQIRRQRAEQVTLGQEFYCRPRRRRLTIETCMEDYVSANAFGDKHSACHKCAQGCTNRQEYAESR